MSPDVEIRLKSVIKSLEQIILPAIGPEHILAREQLSIAVGHLEMIRLQWPFMESYAARCLRDMWSFAEAIVEQADAVGFSHRAVDALTAFDRRPAGGPLLSAKELWEERNRVAARIDDIIFAVAEAAEPQRRSIEAIVLERCSQEHTRDRAWFARTGLDPEADGRRPLSEIFDQASDRNPATKARCPYEIEIAHHRPKD